MLNSAVKSAAWPSEEVVVLGHRARHGGSSGNSRGKSEGGRGRWLETVSEAHWPSPDTGRHGPAFPGVCAGSSLGRRKQRQDERSICRVGPSMLLGFGRMGVLGMGFGWDVFAPVSLCRFRASWEPPTVPSSRKKVVKSKGLLMNAACVLPSEMAPSRPRAAVGFKFSTPFLGIRGFCQTDCQTDPRSRATVRTFVACRWRIVCSSVCHPVHVGGPILGLLVRSGTREEKSSFRSGASGFLVVPRTETQGC